MMEKWQPKPLSREGVPLKRPPLEPVRPESGMPRTQPAEAPALHSSSFGSVPWTEKELMNGLREFLAVYETRPIVEAEGSVHSVGLFGVWSMLRSIRPELVIESGLNTGLTTWMIEKALPQADLVCLDKDLSQVKYRGGKAIYVESGFMEADLVPEGEIALAMFDDHGDAIERVRKCKDLGIRHLFFDDNYPEHTGNRHRSIAACLGDAGTGSAGYPMEKAFLLEAIESYCIFPPVFEHRAPVSLERSLILEPSLLGPFDARRHGDLLVFHRDMPGYRWPTYLKLK